MARFWQRTMDLLGFGDEDGFDDYDERQVLHPRRVGYDDDGYGAHPAPGVPGGYGGLGGPSGYGQQGYGPAAMAAGPTMGPPGAVRPVGPGTDGGVVSISSQPARRGADHGDRGSLPSAQATSTVRTVTAQPAAKKVHVVRPAGFSECKEIGERFRNGEPVIVDLTAADRDLTRRVIDFASGLVFALSGDIRKVADKVFMLTPSNVEVSAEDRRRLEERGYRA
jgi:cell division inhibitor SepF